MSTSTEENLSLVPYAVEEGKERQRSDRQGNAREAATFTTNLISTGERDLATSKGGEYARVIQAVTFTLLTLVTATYLFDRAHEVSRGWILALWVLACALVVGFRALARLVAPRLAAAGVVGRRVLIVGTHPEALAMEWLLRRQRHLGLHVAGFIDDALPAGTAVQAGRTVVGTIADLREHLARERYAATGQLLANDVTGAHLMLRPQERE